MKSRLTSWLAALLLITTVFGLPVTRVATNRIACYQVYCEERKEDRDGLLVHMAPGLVVEREIDRFLRQKLIRPE